MEKEQVIDQMIKEVKKTCTENGLEVLMLVGEDKGDKIGVHQFMRISDNMMGALIYDLIEDEPHLAEIIRKVNDLYLSRRMKKAFEKDFEELFKAIRGAARQMPRG